MNMLKKLSSIWSKPADERPLTNEQIKLIQDSWSKVLPIQETAAELFYGRLFETAPEVKPLFKGDMKEQGAKLMKMIGVVVNGLPKLGEIVPAVQELGRRHVHYGVKDEHYAVVGSSLIWTLEQGLGDAFTEDTKTSWVAAYAVLSDAMIAAATEVVLDEPAEAVEPAEFSEGVAEKLSSEELFVEEENKPLVTPAQVKLVQDSWSLVVPIQEAAAGLFYGQLFETAPEVEPLFTSDIKEQGEKLMKMITVAVNGLNNLEAIVPAVQELAKRHIEYGVKDEHYDAVGASLIWTLEQGLGEAFTVETKEAWVSVYGLLSSTMIAVAKD